MIFKLSSRIRQLRQEYTPFVLGTVQVIGLVTVSIALLGYAYLGTFSRYYADDYCLSGMYFTDGFMKAVANLYLTWSNRYAGMILLSFSELFGRSAIHFWLAFTLIVWVPTLAWTLLQAGRLLHLNFSKWMVLLLAEVLIFFLIIESPNLFQTLLWRIGLITYTLPLVFLTLLVGLILNGILKDRDGSQSRQGLILGLIGCLMVAFFAGGLSETYVSLQTGLLGLALLCTFLVAKAKTRRVWFWWLGVSLIGSLIALLIVLLAPGNTIRQASMLPSTGIFELVYGSVMNAFLFMYISFHNYSFQLLLLFFLSMLLTYMLVSSNTVPHAVHPVWLVCALLLTPLIGYLMIIIICAPSMYAESSYPEARVLIEAGFFMVLMTSVEGLVIGIGLGQLHTLSNEAPPVFLKIAVLLISLGILLYPLYYARRIYQQIPDYQARASAWDARDATILIEKTRGLENIQVVEFDSISGISELSRDENFWVNACAASFYGVQTIEAVSLP
jgi:hypothetical protein